MGKKAPKASRKLAAKGELKRQIQERHKHQKTKQRIDTKRAQKARGKGKGKVVEDGEEAEEEEDQKKDSKYVIGVSLVRRMILRSFKIQGNVSR